LASLLRLGRRDAAAIFIHRADADRRHLRPTLVGSRVPAQERSVGGPARRSFGGAREQRVLVRQPRRGGAISAWLRVGLAPREAAETERAKTSRRRVVRDLADLAGVSAFNQGGPRRARPGPRRPPD